MSPSTLSRRNSPSTNTNQMATDHNTDENSQQQQKQQLPKGKRHNNRVAANQRKKSLLCVAIIGALFTLLSVKLQNITIEEKTTIQDGTTNDKNLPEDNDHLINTTPLPLKRRVRFIPYPHKTLGSGDSIQCQWQTRHAIDTSSLPLDFTQKNAYSEGVCIPPSLNNTIHIFSSAEAIQCLSSEVQQRDIRVILAGDSYMKQMYIGLTDILLSKHSRDGIEMTHSTQRSNVLSTVQTLMRNRRKNGTFPFVEYKCEVECYGKGALDLCTMCLNNFRGNTDNAEDVWVVGVGIHTYQRAKHQLDVAAQNIRQFLDTKDVQNRTIYVSPPYYFYREDYPDQSTNMERLYRDLLPHVAPENPAHPFLDVFQLTKSCTHKNCTFDGGHRSRYVNRWKAQLLLNTLCEVQ